ncbi:hypothetical protein F0L68_28045 [Solihabitans fulvus]|uniref:PBP domain-containing protein n=1 Tax=Solihabitans fulvus TaxID=1892852 RepID=A0A5B2WYY6_9PSEU|nr:hypothetical protein [Solihabitans fulvus]KAA2255649.1 hypothetical protein F0L68_28045 [Solihabitans fulvus]
MTMSWNRRRTGSRVALVGFVLAILGGWAMLPAALAPAGAATVGPADGSAQAMTLTQTFDQTYAPDQAGAAYKGSVTVSRTGDLVRQRVRVSWSGLRPTVGTGQYPVVIMQCWGAPQEVTQQHCWGGKRLIDRATAVDASPVDPAVYGLRNTPQNNLLKRLLTFQARDGRKYAWDTTDVDASGNPGGFPDGSVRNGPPPDRSPDTFNEILPPIAPAVTKADGTGQQTIEVLSATQLPSLGCTASAACSLVVVPVGEPNCLPTAQIPFPSVFGPACKVTANHVDTTMRSFDSWKSPTNWSHRFVFPLSFRPTPQVCAADSRPETSLTGSPYLGQVMESWRPKFCGDPSLFKLGYANLGESDARAQFTASVSGGRTDGVNAVLTSQPATDLGKPVVYAPVAVTGFAVSFVLDDQNGNEVTSLRLNARMLAKLITQSYNAAGVGASHPTIGTNPTWWGADKEFLALNPGLAVGGVYGPGAASPVIALGGLDMMHALTGYIAADPAAVAWLAGTPDEFGTVVNPVFRNYPLPVDQAEQRDAWKVPSGVFQGRVWLDQTANRVDTVLNAAIAVLQAQQPSQTDQSCADPSKPETCVFSKPGRQPYGTRSLLALTDLGDSHVLGLSEAALQTSSGAFLPPTQTSLAYGLRATTLDQKTGILAPNYAAMDARAYPGTTVVYAGVPTSGLPKDSAGNFATFLEYAAGAGQEYGTTVGKLPDGYLALPDPLREQTRNAAKAVRAQQGDVPPPPPSVATDPAAGTLPPISAPGQAGGVTGPSDQQGGQNGTGPVAQNRTPAPAAAPATAKPSSAVTSSVKPQASAETRTDSSSFARWALPVLLGLGVLAGALAPLTPVLAQPGHPVRRWLARQLRRSR